MTKVCSTLEELSSESTIRETLQQSHSVSFPHSYDVYDLETLIRLLEPRYTDATMIDEDYLTVAKCMVVCTFELKYSKLPPYEWSDQAHDLLSRISVVLSIEKV